MSINMCKKKKVQKFGLLRFLVFLKEMSSAHQSCIYLIKNTVKTSIAKYNNLNFFLLFNMF